MVDVTCASVISDFVQLLQSLNLVCASVELRVFVLRVRGVILLVDAFLCFGYMITEK